MLFNAGFVVLKLGRKTKGYGPRAKTKVNWASSIPSMVLDDESTSRAEGAHFASQCLQPLVQGALMGLAGYKETFFSLTNTTLFSSSSLHYATALLGFIVRQEAPFMRIPPLGLTPCPSQSSGIFHFLR